MRNILLALSVCVGILGCVDNQIGRPCNDLGKAANGVNFVNPAPDCPTRLCMVTPPLSAQQMTATGNHRSGSFPICTAFCDSNSDCAASSDYTGANKCKQYVCAIPSVVPGADNFCCQKLCTCQDDLIPGFNSNDPIKPGDPAGSLTKEGDVVIPTACTGTVDDPTSHRHKTCSL